jgi:hypothetical protein
MTAAALRVRRRDRGPRGMAPLPPQRKWRAIALATVVLVPAMWSILAGLVAAASDDPDAPDPLAPIALGLAILPFVFVALAFLSEHPSAPRAVVRALWVAPLVGLFASVLAVDAVTGLVAGVAAGGVVTLRADADHSTRARAYAVAVAAAYTFVLARVAGPVVLLGAPVFPFTALGVADHLSERRAERGARPL